MTRAFLRIYAILTALLLATLGGALLVRSLTTARPLLQALENAAEPIAAAIASDFAPVIGDAAATEALRATWEQRLGAPVRVVAAADVELGPRARRRLEERGVALDSSPGEGVLYVRLGAGGTLLGVGPRALASPVAGRDALVAVAFALGIAFLAALAAALFVVPLHRQLRELERAAVRFGGGDLASRARVARRSALGGLSASFNAMAERIGELVRGREDLLRALSHELRSPLARLRFATEMAAGARDDAERGRLQSEIERDLRGIELLTEELEAALRLGGTGPPPAREPVDLEPLLARAAAMHATSRPEIAIAIDGGAAGAVVGDARWIERAVANLVANAVRHARTQVALRVRREGDAVAIEVEDDGPGVPQADRERVFEPFVRLDPPRTPNRAPGGMGLGLAIVRRVAELHGGSATCRPAASGSGAVFSLRVPWREGDQGQLAPLQRDTSSSRAARSSATPR